MASFTAGTTFVDGVANDVTAAKLGALVTNATPTSGLIQDRTAETVVATNDTFLIGDASDSNTLKRMTVANVMKAELTGTINTTAGTITTLNSTTGTITTGVIPTLTSITKITSGTGTAAAPAISPTGDTNTGIFFPAADTIAFAEGGTEAMRIDASGNVGIGITSPDAKLAFSNTTGEKISLYNTSNNYRFGLGIGQTGTSFNTKLYGADYADAGVQIGVVSSSDGTTFNPAISVIGSGNVGIGTTSPDAKLEIEGVGSTASDPSTTSSIDATIGLRSGTGSGNGGMLMFGSTQGYHVAIKGFLTNGASNTTGDLLFCTRTNVTNTTLTEAMRIDGSGNVGIGDSTPTAKLDVNGSFNATSGTIATFNSTTGTIATFNSTTGTIPTLVATTLLTTGTGTAAAPAIVPTGDTNTGFFFPAADTIAFAEGGAEAMRITSSGNVSIGTATALSKLHVHGDLTMSNATTAITASTSTITPPATVAGYLTVSINGTSRKIPYYAT